MVLPALLILPRTAYERLTWLQSVPSKIIRAKEKDYCTITKYMPTKYSFKPMQHYSEILKTQWGHLGI